MGKIETTLAKQFVKYETPDAVKKALGEANKHPEYRRAIDEFNKVMVDDMLKQSHRCGWAQVTATRQKNYVDLEWKSMRGASNCPATYSVDATAEEIKFIPDPEKLNPGWIVLKHPNDGSIRLELEEGVSYCFGFEFHAEGLIKENAPTHLMSLSFQVGIPMSDEKLAAVRSTVFSTTRPAERVRNVFEEFLQKDDAFDEACAEAIKRIKAKGLSPEDERQKIEDFKDYAEQMKDKFGM